MDASIEGASVRYARWFSNDYGAAPYTDTLLVQASFNGGATWTTVETVGPDGPEVSGGWYEREVLLGTLPGYQATAAFRLRFTTSDGADSGSVVEAGVDAIAIVVPDCDDDPSCQGDVDGDGVVDVVDLLAVIADWNCVDDCPADVNGDSIVNVEDVLIVLANFGCA